MQGLFKYLFVVSLILLITSCVHYPDRLEFTQEELDQYRSTALNLVAEGAFIVGRKMTYYVHKGEYDSTKPIRYDFKSGKNPRIFISVPVRTSANIREDYTIFEFEPHSTKVVGVSYK